ncbi:FG-GAP-like repeat-containing protein [Wenjunlia tyrosinilytica]|uniref:Uncharacterized protein n=1 Tax=Wenjunlia tyrosinilytica TaxID=1544741 RepID=A0A917ZL56_9ACTN|nr:FG-GAP-like repeat-containing protein [Wenjunlia tyrosinilytica]GGO84852.1 hypothetical protein GCM10012280_17280 [Wenjunlia tyrosinilytica]
MPDSDDGTDDFGSAVSVGDVNGDGYPDVAVGAPNEDYGGLENAGKVTVLPGRKGGLSGTGAKAFTSSTSGVPGTAKAQGDFGIGLKVVDTNGDGRAEVLVGALDGTENGALWSFRGTSSGTTVTGSRHVGATALGLPAGAGLRVGSRYNC